MSEVFPNRRWLVIPTTITGSIDYNQVIEYSPESLRYSIDTTQTFVKYEINEITASYTQSYYNAETGQTGSYTVQAGIYGRPSIYSSSYQEYNHEDILTLLSTEAWTSPIIEL
jgi:hypothetical protein